MTGSFEMINEDSSDMSGIETGSVDLIITSPPYFSVETEALLNEPLKDHIQINQVQDQVTKFAHTLSPVFDEIHRVLKPGGAVIIQTKDLRYGKFLITLAETHRQQVLDIGLYLITKVYWQSQFPSQAQKARMNNMTSVGSFCGQDVEEFQVYTTGEGFALRGAPIELEDEERDACSSPLWCLPGPGNSQTHPYQSPASVLKKFIALFSAPGDRVLDPFAGHGIALRLAASSGRHAVGYEIDGEHVKKARALFQSKRR